MPSRRVATSRPGLREAISQKLETIYASYLSRHVYEYLVLNESVVNLQHEFCALYSPLLWD
jgi:hypothetical protein